MAHLSLSLLGPFQATLAGEPITRFESNKMRALLAYLAVEADRPHSREVLAGLFWAHWPDRAARSNLRSTLAKLRNAIDDRHATPPFLLITRETIQFNSGSDHRLDVAEFTASMETNQAGPQVRRHLEDAVDLYRGSFLEGFSLGDSPAFEDWCLFLQERLQRQAATALRRLAAYYEESGAYERACVYARRQVELEPWQEEAHCQLMRLLALNGERGAALTQYRTCCRLLSQELAVEPAPETTRLYEQIRDGELRVPQTPFTPLPDHATRRPAFLEQVAPGEPERPVFVARERELACLRGYLEAALGGNGQVVFITGDAGQGKTALLDAFAQRAMDRHPDLLVASGKCNAYSGVGDPYLPFRDVTAMLTGDVEARWAAGVISRDHACRLWDSLPCVAQLLADRGPELVGTFLPGRELLDRATAAAPGGADWLTRLKDLTTRAEIRPDDLQQQHLFAQYAAVLRGLAVQRPLAIVLDDLQWADEASVSLLFHLGGRLEGSRILIVGAYRPTEVALGRDGGRHPLEAVLSEFKQRFGDVWVDLDQTSEREGKLFVNALLDTEPNQFGADFRRALYQHTGGHPLFTTELLRAMQARGDLAQDEQGRWLEGRSLDWESLPARVEGVIEERIGRLQPELREVLSVASVEGEEFTAQVVANVQALGERRLLWQLSQEVEARHRLVRERGEVQVGTRHLSRYQFTHALFQRYLYQGLGVGVRRLLHREIAAALEELYEDRTEEIAVQLAHHYVGDVERERHYARLAGERAAAQFANAEALRYLARALDLTPDGALAERYAILRARERVYDVQGEREAQAQDLAALEALLEAMPERGPEATGRRAEVLLRRAGYAELIGDYQAAIAAAREAICLAQTAQDARIETKAYLSWGWVLWRQGEYEAARPHFQKALALSRVVQDRQSEAASLRNLGNVCWHLGDYGAGRAYYEQSLRICSEMGDRRGQGTSYNNLGIVAAELGNYSRAKVCYEQALRIKREIGDRVGASIVLENLANIFAHQGNYAEAKTHYEQALHIFREAQHRQAEAIAWLNLTLLYHHLGDNKAATECGHQALAIVDDIGARNLRGYALTFLGHAWAGLGRLTEAAVAYEQALALRQELSQPNLALEPMAGLARLSLVRGDAQALSQARAQVEGILAHLQTDPSLFGIEEPFLVYLTCYRVLRASQDPRADEILDRAYRLLQERAEKIGQEEVRRSFLEEVTAHREIVKEWENLRVART